MRPLACLLLLLGVLCSTRPVSAASIPAPAPPAAAVAAGAEVVTAIPDLPADIEEIELLLVPDSGPEIRVSRELPGGTREIRWHMPAISARHARLVLRAGEEHEEWESAPSAAFDVSPLPPGELSLAIRGRSAAGHRIESLAGAAAAGLLAAPAPVSLAPAAATANAVESSSPALVAPSVRTLARNPCATRALLVPADSGDAMRAPVFVPLRN